MFLGHLKSRFLVSSLGVDATSLANQADLSTTFEHLASISNGGLNVKFEGSKLRVRPWRPGGSLFEWSSLLPSPVTGFPCRTEDGSWIGLDDHFRGATGNWSPDDPQCDLTRTNPLLEDLRRDNIFLIRDPEMPANAIQVESQNGAGYRDEVAPFFVHIRRNLRIRQHATPYAKAMEAIRDLARRELSRCGRSDMTHLQNVSSMAFDCDPSIRAFIRDQLGTEDRDNAWLMIPYYMPFDVVLEPARTSSWVVDRDF